VLLRNSARLAETHRIVGEIIERGPRRAVEAMTELVWIEAGDAILTNLQLVEAFGGLAAGPRDDNLLLAQSRVR